MREAAISGDDVAMLDRVFQPLVLTEAAKEIDAPLLVGRDLRMHERHVQERPRLLVERRIELLVDGAARQRYGYVVGREGGRGLAEHVARELVEQDDRGESRPRIIDRIGVEVRLQPFVEIEKALADPVVQFLAPAEPVLVGEFVEPEGKHLLDPSLSHRTLPPSYSTFEMSGTELSSM